MLPGSDFSNMVAVAESGSSKVGNRQIKFKDQIKGMEVWKIAGIRIDPCAVGAATNISKVFGHSPQIRLVIQPVTVAGNAVTVHDVAFHLIYSFISGRDTPPGVLGKAHPDDAAVQKILAGVLKIRKVSEDAGVDTDGPLGIHPGLATGVPGLTQEIESFLERHLQATGFNFAAVMGLNNGGPEPWIFLSMLRQPLVTGKLLPFPSVGLAPVQAPKFAHMISFLDSPNIQPAPAPTNRGDADKANDLRVPISARRGVSTAVLFTGASLDAPAPIGVDEQPDRPAACERVRRRR